MARETVGPPDWGALPWQDTPYPGVFVSTLSEGRDPGNPEIPLYTTMAVKIDPTSSIPRHIHKREPNWQEQINFEEPGDFEILRVDGSEIILNVPLILTIKPNEVFGLKNNSSRPLFFTSYMRPGFTGYEEIEEVDIAR